VACTTPLRRLKQASHWHDKQFTPWRAIKGRTRDSVRGDAWGCGSGEIVRAVSRRGFWNALKNSRCHDCRATILQLRKQFVNCEQTRHNYWVTGRANAYRDVNILEFSPQPGTHYPHPHAPPRTLLRFRPSLVRQTACHGDVNRSSCQREACFTKERVSEMWLLSTESPECRTATRQTLQLPIKLR